MKICWKCAGRQAAWLVRSFVRSFVRSPCCCFNFQSQLKFVNFTYNFKVGKCDATHSEKRWAQWKQKKKLQLKYLRDFVTTTTASVDGGKFGVELTCSHRTQFPYAPYPVQSTWGNYTQRSSEDRIAWSDHSRAQQSVEWAFHLAVRGLIGGL